MIAQIARAVFIDFPPGFYFVVTVTGIILVLAANTAFNGFPVLGSILAQDGYAPRALGSRGDRLAYSNGIVFLAVMAIILIQAFNAETTRLIQLYIVGVFVSFNLSQLGMIRHWTRHLKTEQDPAVRRRMFRSRAINAIGLSFTAVVLVIVLITKFLAGAWITILAMIVFFMIMQGDPPPLRQRQRRARRRRGGQGHAHPGARDRPGLQAAQADAAGAGLRQGDPAQRARGRLRRHRPRGRPTGCWRSGTSATSASRSRCCTRRTASWSGRSSTTPWRSRRPTRAGWSRSTSRSTSSGRWWEQLLHNQTALRLKGRLLFAPGVMVTSVPYQLRSSQIARERERARAAPGSAPATCAAARSTTAADRDPGQVAAVSPPPARRASARGALPRRRAVRGRGRPGRARRPLRRPAARRPRRRVVFVRHALPGERVVLEITEGTDGDRFWRGDAVEVLEPRRTGSTAPCPYAGPGRCGGCDFQHVTLPRAARRSRRPWCASSWPGWRSLDVPVDRRAGRRATSDGLRWRTRRAVRELPGRPARRCASTARREVVAGRRLPDRPHRRRAASRRDRTPGRTSSRGDRAGAHDFAVDADGFWQVHPGAPRVLVETVLELLAPQPGERVLDLYAGVGLFARVPRRRGRARSRVVAVEGDRARRAARPRQPRRTAAAPRVEAGASTGVLAASYDEPSTSSSSTRRARAPAARSSSRSSTGRRAPWPTSPATRPRWPATWRSSPSTATR